MKVTWLTCRQEVRCMHSRLESGIQDFISMISREQKWYSIALKFDPKRPCYIYFGHWNTWSWSPELPHEKNRLPRGHRAMRCPGYVKKPCAGFLTNDPSLVKALESCQLRPWTCEWRSLQKVLSPTHSTLLCNGSLISVGQRQIFPICPVWIPDPENLGAGRIIKQWLPGQLPSLLA